MRRRHSYSNRRQKRFLELLWPFLVMILLGVILILLIQFVMTWLDQRQAELKNKVYFYLDEGTAQVLPWGQAEWTKAYNQLVLEGDVIRMGPASRGLLTFFNDTAVRLDGDAKVEIKKIESSKDEDVIYLDVDNGRTWLNVADSEDPLRLVVTTDNLRVTSFGTIFEVGVTDRETVRVMDGDVLVEVVDESNGREIVLDQVRVGVGQQVKMTAADVTQIQSRLPVFLLEAVDDEWKETSWFAWNRAEDESPVPRAIMVGPEVLPEVSEVGSMEPAAAPAPAEADVTEMEATLDEDTSVSEVAPADAVPPVVSVSVPTASPYTLTEAEANATFSIRGTTTENTTSVIVTSYDENGTPSPYTLTHYAAGDSAWRYGVAREFGNLREGRNLFTVVAVNADGVKSKALEVVLIVEEGAFVDVAEAASGEEASDEATAEVSTSGDEAAASDAGAVEGDVTTSSGDEVAEAPADEGSDSTSTEPLTAPRVVSVNGATLPAGGRYTSGAEVVTVVGSVSANATKVFVNNYQLAKYVSGSGEWSYVVRPEFLNYEVGLNTYTVVAEDALGNRASFTFEIFRQAP